MSSLEHAGVGAGGGRRSSATTASSGGRARSRLASIGLLRQVPAGFALLALLLAGAILLGLASPAHRAPAGAPRTGARRLAPAGLLSLPPSAQGPVSEALGAENTGYVFAAAAGGFRSSTPAQGLRTSFTSDGVSVSAGASRLGLRLQAVGLGSTLAPLAGVTPTLHSGRVVYAHPGVKEWYANGPVGLEQGFTLTRPPAVPLAVGPLTLSIAFSGDTHPTLAEGGHGMLLQRAGRTVLRYKGLTASDARGRTLHSWMVLEGHRLLVRVDARGAVYPLRIDPFVQQGSKLLGTGESGNGSFGWNVALSANGDTALIGAPSDNGDVGAAWVFTRSGTTWTQQGEKLTGGGEEMLGEFGWSVALSANGDTALIGGPRDHNGSDGAAWVFTRSGEKWTQQGEKLVGTGEEPSPSGEYFGWSVALSAEGNTALIGGWGDNGEKGAAYVFTRSGEKWTQEGEKLVGGGQVGEAEFGFSVALSSEGNTAVIGAPIEGANEVGSVYVFTRSAGKWSQQGERFKAKELVLAENPFFGISVAVSANGDIALIGAKGDDENVGAAWVFTRSDETWRQDGTKLTGEKESGEGRFGVDVALNAEGTIALIGGRSDNAGAGAAWEFTRAGETWTEAGAKLKGAGESGKSEFGSGVALSSEGNTALIGGGPFEIGGVGAAWALVTGPTVTSHPASEVKPKSATVNASVDPNEEAVSECKFEYGTTTAYGSSASCTPSAGSGGSPVSVSASLSSLTEDTVYHYRVSATNADGTNVSRDETFTTLLSSESATNKKESEPAKAQDGPISATASKGVGTVTVGQYGENPGGVRLIGSAGEYVDVYRSAMSSFTKIEYEDCELGGGTTLYWYDPHANGEAGEWQVVTKQTYVAGSPDCIDAVAESSGTAPTVAQMTGTRFKAASSIAAPEFGRCAAAPLNGLGKPEGFFTAKTCLEKGLEGVQGEPLGKDEWEVDVLEEQTGQPATHFTLSAASAKLETAQKGSKVACTGVSGEGKFTGPKSVGAITMKLTGCAQAGQACTSADANAGEIKTKTLEGVLGWEEQSSKKVGLELHPSSGVFAEFDCGATAISVRGSVIAPLKANKMSATPALKLKGSKGVQKPEGFEGGPKEILEESSDGGSSYEAADLSAAITQMNENSTEAEVNTAF